MTSTTDDDQPPPSTDAQVDEPEPAGPSRSNDLEAPEADALDQAREVTAGWHVGRRPRDIEVPENDAVDQATEIPDESDY